MASVLAFSCLPGGVISMQFRWFLFLFLFSGLAGAQVAPAGQKPSGAAPKSSVELEDEKDRPQPATAYPRLLLFAEQAKKEGLDKEPHYREMMRFASLQILAQDFTRAVQKNAANIPEADLEQYYKNNQAKFQQADLQRIFIPR